MQWSHSQEFSNALVVLSYHIFFKLVCIWFVYMRSQCIGFVIEGKASFNNRSLHAIGDTPNPYEKAISIIGKTLAPFDEDNLIPCYGFGDGMSSSLKLNIWISFSHFLIWSLDLFFVIATTHDSQWPYTLPWFWRSFVLLQKNSSQLATCRLVLSSFIWKLVFSLIGICFLILNSWSIF